MASETSLLVIFVQYMYIFNTIQLKLHNWGSLLCQTQLSNPMCIFCCWHTKMSAWRSTNPKMFARLQKPDSHKYAAVANWNLYLSISEKKWTHNMDRQVIVVKQSITQNTILYQQFTKNAYQSILLANNINLKPPVHWCHH